MRKSFKYSIVGLVLALLSLFLIAHCFNLPRPSVLLAMVLGMSPPSQSHINFASAPIAASPRSFYIPENPRAISPVVSWHNGTKISFDQFLQLTHTNALLVVHHGELIYENYYRKANRATIFSSFSLSKSVVSDLIGIALEEGKISSVYDSIVKYLPTVPVTYSILKIDDLLNMRSGIQVNESYRNIFSKIVYMYLTTDLTRFIDDLRYTAITPAPEFEYRSVDYLLLGMVLSSATGESLSHYLQTRIWQPMGAEYDASWSIDSKFNRVEKGFCCLNARAIDFAKFGLMHLQQGYFNGRQIVPKNWAQRPRISAHVNSYFDYGNGWWLPRLFGNHQDFLAMGIHGQFIYIDPVSQTVIVKLSDHGPEEDEALIMSAFRDIVAVLSGN